jgi:hypothetical protein
LGFAAWGTVFGRGPPAAYGVTSTLVLMFLIGIATPCLVLAADAGHRRRTERALRATRAELQQTREQFAQSQKMEAVGQLVWRMTSTIF